MTENRDSDWRAIGRLEGKFEEISGQLTDLREANSREHSAVVVRLDAMAAELRRSLDEKADKDVVAAQGVILDKLKTDRDLAVGVFRFGAAFKGALGFILAAVGYMVGGGKHP